jgi:hypothetical protein
MTATEIMRPDAHDLARMISVPQGLWHLGFRVCNKNRADRLLCRGNNRATVACRDHVFGRGVIRRRLPTRTFSLTMKPAANVDENYRAGSSSFIGPRESEFSAMDPMDEQEKIERLRRQP